MSACAHELDYIALTWPADRMPSLRDLGGCHAFIPGTYVARLATAVAAATLRIATQNCSSLSRDELAFFDQLDDPLHAVRDVDLVRSQYEVRLLGRFIRRAHAREVGDFALVGRAVEAFLVPLAADFDRGVEVDDEEAVAADDFGGFLADFFAGRQERRDADQARLVHEPGDLGAATKIFRAVVDAKAQVAADALSH